MTEPLLSTAAPTAAGDPPRDEGCPTPLAWADVLEAFRTERDEFLLPTSWGDVSLWEFGEGRPLVCLGGAAGDMELFALVAWLLRSDYRCLLLTLPQPPSGVAQRHWIPGGAQLVVEVMARRELSAPIFATGYGGLLALQAAIEAPDRVERLILQGCPLSRDWCLRERAMLALGRRLQRPISRIPMWEAVIESNHRRWFPPFDAGRWRFLHDNLGATPTRRFAGCMSAWRRPELSSRLGDVAAPVLLLRSEGEGAAASRGQEELAARLPHARVEWMHTTGEFPHVTHPHRVVKLLRQFLTEESPASAAASG